MASEVLSATSTPPEVDSVAAEGIRHQLSYHRIGLERWLRGTSFSGCGEGREIDGTRCFVRWEAHAPHPVDRDGDHVSPVAREFEALSEIIDPGIPTPLRLRRDPTGRVGTSTWVDGVQ